jgi:hypothetical protein
MSEEQKSTSNSDSKKQNNKPRKKKIARQVARGNAYGLDINQ